MTMKDRRRRVVLICSSFARNLAFYEVGMYGQGKPFLDNAYPQTSFWRQANSNFLDICVMEWCKLLGDKNAEHHWNQVVSDGPDFEAGLLKHIGISASSFEGEIKAIRHYRDKFVAHLDKLPVMDIPVLRVAKAAVWFYHSHVVTHEAQAGELAGIPADTPAKLTVGYEQCLEEAKAVFSRA
jgi:hypothetical protein